MKTAALSLILSVLASAALAKLPAPVLDDAAKAKAAEAAAKTAWQGKVDAFQLCKAQDRVAAHVKGAKPVKGAAPSTCADPGAFVFPPPDPAKAQAAAPAAPTAKAAPAPAAPAKKS